MDIVCIGLGDCHLGRTTTGPDGQVVQKKDASWEPNPQGGTVAIWTMDTETEKPTSPAEVFGDWDAAAYLARALELIRPNRRINLPDLPAMIRVAYKMGFDICDHCLECRNCQDCAVNTWKGENDDEQNEN